MEQEFHCDHQTGQLLICISGQCKDDHIKHVVCSKCCFITHNHGMMSFTKLTNFEKRCYKLSPLLDKKSDIEEMVKNKFKRIREEIIEELNQKENNLLNKLERIVSNDVATVVKQAFQKNQIMDAFRDQAQKIINRISDVDNVEMQLDQCQKELNSFRITNNLLSEESCQSNSIHHQRSQGQPIQQQKIVQETTLVKTENKQRSNFALTKYANGQSVQENKAHVIIDLEDLLNIPLSIIGNSFFDVSNILTKNQNSDLVELNIEINSNKKQSVNPQMQDLEELYKIKFFNNLSQLKSLQVLTIKINSGENLSIDNVIRLQQALLTASNLKSFKLDFYSNQPQAILHSYSSLTNKLGQNNIIILPRTNSQN